MNTRLILILLLLSVPMLSTPVLAQQNVLDSLQNILEQSDITDSTRVDVLIKMAGRFTQNNLPKATEYADKAILLAKKIHNEKDLAEAMRIKGIVLGMQNNYKEALKLFQEALSLSKKTNHTIGINTSYINIGNIYLYFAEYDNALSYYQKSLELSIELNNHKLMAQIYNNIGTIYQFKSEYPKAIDHFEKALQLNQESYAKSKAKNTYNGIASCYNNLGATYEKMGQRTRALEYYLKALKVNEDLDIKKGVASNLSNIALIYAAQKDIDLAMENFAKSIKVNEALKDSIALAATYNNIGSIQSKSGNIDIAFEYYSKALDILERKNNKQDLIEVYNNLASFYLKIKQEDKSREYFAKANKLMESLELKEEQVANNSGRSDLALKENKPEEAYKLALQAYNTAKSIGNANGIKSSSLALAKASAALEKWDEAYKYHIEHKIMSDSILNEQNIRQNTESRLTFQFEKEKEIKELEMKNKQALFDANLKRQTLVRNAMIGILFLVILVLFFIYRAYRIKNKANSLLSAQAKEIQSKNNELKEINDKLVELDRFKEGMTGMIVHDLKNPLNSILNNSNIERVHQAGKQMLNLVMNILDVQKFETASMVLDMQPFAAYQIAQNAFNQVAMLVHEKNIQFENYIPPTIGINTESEILERVFVNLLTNAVKYTPNNGEIIIRSELYVPDKELQVNSLSDMQSTPMLMIKISDTGQGIPADKIHLVFEKFGQIQAKNSGKIRSTGLGLTFCKLAVEAHGGEIGVVSEVNKGTTFWFTIPLGKEVHTDNKVVAESATNKVILWENDKKILLPLLPQLKELEFYEVSSIRNILKQIEEIQNDNLQNWLYLMRNTLRSGNEEQYVELINSIEHE